MTTVVALALAALAVVVLADVVATRTGLPSAVLLTVVGVAYAALPGPNIVLDPDLVLVVLIPPLLYAAALSSSLIALRQNAHVVINLSVVLVIATALVVGGVLHAVVPAVPFAAAVALGAAVAPPDPVAALAIGRRAGLPPKLITLVEGEGLLNDATALTLLQVAAAAAVGGGFSWGGAVGVFALEAVGGVVVGMAAALVLGRLRGALHEVLVDNALSLATPFVAYLAAVEVHASGVLAVVVAGLWTGYRAPEQQSGQARLQSRAVWRLVEMLLEGFVFLLIGQQLPTVLSGLGQYSTATTVTAVLTTAAVVLLLRPLWLWGSAHLPRRLHLRLWPGSAQHQATLSGRELTALSWAGTRGVITLAAAFSLPLTVHGGGDFPARDLLLLCAYVVVLVTLIGQGLTFAPLLRRLRLENPVVDQAILRNQARLAGVEARLARLEQIVQDEPAAKALAEPLRRAAEERRRRSARRVATLSAAEENEMPVDEDYLLAARIRHAMIDAAREEYLEWRSTGRLPDSSLRVLQRELDLEESLLPERPES
jgi:CPA1 family monovalent cation:H+ antiporter